jgi:hypothetical protein
MLRWSELAARIRVWLRRDRFENDLRDEMRLHLDLRERRHRESGLRPGDARSAAHRQFGNTASLCERSRDAWGLSWLEQFVQDVHYGLRTMARTPGFTAVAVVALALGIGANTAIFSVVNAVLLRPLPYRDPERLVTVLRLGRDPVSPANYLDWRDQSRSFDGMAGADYWTPNLTGMNAPEHLWGLKVTQNLLPMLGVAPLLGRVFVAGEDQAGREHEVVLGYKLWQRRFAGDRHVLGTRMRLDGELYTVIGVMPPEFQFAPFWATHAELWVPNVLTERVNRDSNHLRVFARLKPGVSLAQARTEVASITARLERQYPGTNRGIRVTPLKENVVGKVETPMLVLLGAVGFVLLIACANVAHMLLARAAARRREIAVRAALGAGRSRMIRQFFAESLLLAAMGGAAGLLLAYFGTHALVALSPPNLPRVQTVAIDLRAVVFLQGVTLLASLLFGLVPAMHASLSDLAGAVKEGGRGGSEGIRGNRVRSLLVTSEVALALMLLIGAGLMIRSFAALQAVDPGFNPHHVLSLVVSVAGSSEADRSRREVFYRELIERVRRLPGVESAGAINHLPLLGRSVGLGVPHRGPAGAAAGRGANQRIPYRHAGVSGLNEAAGGSRARHRGKRYARRARSGADQRTRGPALLARRGSVGKTDFVRNSRRRQAPVGDHCRRGERRQTGKLGGRARTRDLSGGVPAPRVSGRFRAALLLPHAGGSNGGESRGAGAGGQGDRLAVRPEPADFGSGNHGPGSSRRHRGTRGSRCCCSGCSRPWRWLWPRWGFTE